MIIDISLYNLLAEKILTRLIDLVHETETLHQVLFQLLFSFIFTELLQQKCYYMIHALTI